MGTRLANQGGGSEFVGDLSGNPWRPGKHAHLEEQSSDGWNEYPTIPKTGLILEE